MGRKRGLFVMGVVLVALIAAVRAAAAPPLTLTLDATRTGVVDVYLSGSPGAVVKVSELVAGSPLGVATVSLNRFGLGVRPAAALWRCDRRTRHFVASVQGADGTTTRNFTVRTPSCRRRLRLLAPAAARVGRTVPIRVEDRWQTGGVPARICIRGPRGRSGCRAARLQRGRTKARRLIAFRTRGRWRVELRYFGQRASRTVYVGIRRPRSRLPASRAEVLATGDSMMQNVDGFLADRLRRRGVVSDIKVGTGLSRTSFDWIRHARRATRRFGQRATVVFIGANEGVAMRPPGRVTVDCCGEPWIAEYARRARAVMRAYGRGGRRVYWFTLPAARDRLLREVYAAVNQGVRQAAAGQPTVKLLPLDEILTPGFRYRSTTEVNGRRVPMHEQDGIHLSVRVASLAASFAVRAVNEDLR